MTIMPSRWQGDAFAALFAKGNPGAREFAALFAPRLQFFLQQLHAHRHIDDSSHFRAKSPFASVIEAPHACPMSVVQ